MIIDEPDTPRELALEFETLCAEILQRAGYVIDREPSPDAMGGSGWRIDFVATLPASRTDASPERRLIDVKWMPMAEATLRITQNLAFLHKAEQKQPSGTRNTLILSASIPPARQTWVESESGTEIWGREKLLAMATPQLHAKLEDFLVRSDGWHAHIVETRPLAEVRPIGEAIRLDRELQRERQDAFTLALSSDPTESGVSGAELCLELSKVPRGKKGAKAFEDITERIFAYLFPGDLVLSGSAAKRTEDGLNIYDLAFQIRNRSEFWTGLARDLRTRVLIVECKNYVKPIRAMQVYTTERYLSPAALRSIALIVTRSAPDASAIEAASGALRDNGKLMLILDDKALCSMLHARDLQKLNDGPQSEENDPAEVINGRLHQFLARLPR